MNHRLSLIAALAVAAAVAGTSAAVAQPYGQPYQPPSSRPPEVRKGLTAGASLGLGELSCEDESSTGTGPCDGVTEAGSLDGHLGVMLSPRLALMGDIWIMGHTENDLTVSQTISTIGAQLWLTPRLWIKGGLGIAHARFRFDGAFIDLESESETVPAGMLGVGYEVVHKPNFALDLSLRGGTGVYEDEQTRAHNVAVTLGLSWY